MNKGEIQPKEVCPISGSLTIRQEMPVTHGDPYIHFGLYGSEKRYRIYSGPAETIVLTLIVKSYGAPNVKVEVLVNGASIPDGEIIVFGDKARTFKLRKASNIDVAKISGETATCSYFISLPL